MDPAAPASPNAGKAGAARLGAQPPNKELAKCNWIKALDFFKSKAI